MKPRLFISSLKALPLITRRSSNSKPPLIDGVQPVPLAVDVYESETREGPETFPVLITHGLGGSKANWMYIGRNLAENCKPRRKIFASDVRNHGDSPNVDEHSYEHMSADLHYVMQINKFTKAAVMGHSMGGRSAMYFSLIHTDLVDKLIVLDVSPVNRTEKSEFSFIKSLLETMMKAKLPKNVSRFEARAIVDQQLTKNIPHKRLRQFLLTNLIEKEDRSYAWRLNLPVLIKNFYSNIRSFPDVKGKVFNGPVMFLVGQNSDFVRPTDADYIQKLFPKVKFVVIAKSGHWLHTERPKDVTRHCIKFLNG